jgi:hypothetical protein
MGTHGVQDFCPALAALVGLVQFIFFPHAHSFTAFVCVTQQARQAVVPRRLSFNMCLLETLCPLRWIDREREAIGCGVGSGMAWGSAAVCGKGSGLAKSLSVYQLTSKREGRGRGGKSFPVLYLPATEERGCVLSSVLCTTTH